MVEDIKIGGMISERVEPHNLSVQETMSDSSSWQS